MCEQYERKPVGQVHMNAFLRRR